jgi:hypothetical protein
VFLRLWRRPVELRTGSIGSLCAHPIAKVNEQENSDVDPGANSSGTCKAPVFHQYDCLSMDSPVLRIDAILHCAGGDGEGLGEGVGDGVGVRSPMGDD